MDLQTSRATKIIGIVALLVIAGVSWTVVIGPEMSRLSAVRAQIEETEQKNDVLRAQLARLVKQSEDLADVRKTAKALAAKFPPTADQPGLFADVTEAAVNAGVGPGGVTTLTPSPPTLGGAAAGAAGGGLLATQTLSISISGNYKQTLQLLENLEQMPRAYLVKSVSLGGGGADGFTTTLTGDMFVMPPVQDPRDVDTDEVSSTS